MAWERLAWIGGRWLIALLFAAGAAQKALDPGPAGLLLAGLGLPRWLEWPALAYDAAVAVALVGGWRVAPVALSAAAYCAATSVFHLVPDDPWQISIFVKNWAIAGGCLSLAVAAAGRDRAPLRA